MSYRRQFLLDDQAETLADIQSYLLDNLGVEYSISEISDLCNRLKINRVPIELNNLDHGKSKNNL